MKKDRKEYFRKYQLIWIKKRREKWLQENGPCKVCNSWERLEIDHIIPKDKISNHVWSWSEKRRLEELSKCQVLCKSCHMKKTKIDLRNMNTGKSVHSQRLFPKTIYMEIMTEYFVNKIPRRKIARQYSIHQGTISRWIYGATCQDWFKEFKLHSGVPD